MKLNPTFSLTNRVDDSNIGSMTRGRVVHLHIKLMDEQKANYKKAARLSHQDLSEWSRQALDKAAKPYLTDMPRNRAIKPRSHS